MSKGIPLIRAGMALPVVQLLQRAGAPVERLLERAEISPEAFRDGERLIALHQIGRFLDDAATSQGIPGLGFAAAPLTSVAAVGALGALMCSAPTALEALRIGTALHARYATGGRVWLDGAADRVWLRHAADLRLERGRPLVQQVTLTILLRLLRTLLGPAWRPLEIHTPLDRAPTPAELGFTKPVPTKTSAASTGIAILRRSLAAPVPPESRLHVAPEALKHELLASPAAGDFAGSVRQVAGTLLLDGYPGIERTARAIGLSVRTLQRRLAENSVHYSQLVEQERFERALRLLADPHRKVTDVALTLGYSDVANFTHAFRRWTGLSPRTYRSGRR